MTWAELIREYYKKCMETGCAVDLSLDLSEPGAQYIFATAHTNDYHNRKIIGYIGGSGMVSYDIYKDPDEVVEQNMGELVAELWEETRNDKN